MSGSGEILDDDLRESDEVNYGEESTLSIGSEARDLLSDPPGYIATFLVGGFITMLTAVVGFGLDAVTASMSALEASGRAIGGNIESIQSITVNLVVVPLESMDALAASSGVFAPLVVALTFALVAAIAAGIVWGTFRLVRFL